MATKRFTPKALDKAEQDTITVAGVWAAADTQTSTINEKDLVLTAGSAVATTDIAAAIAAMIAGDAALGTETRSETGNNVEEFKEVAATVSGSVVTVLGNTKGRPITLTSVETTAGSGTATKATVVAATGKSHWDNVDNWGGSAIPVSADTVYLDNCATPILYGLAQSAVVPAALYIARSFTGDVGLPEVNEEGGYTEYRDTYLQIAPTVLTIGLGEGDGSGRIKVNTGTGQVALTVIDTGASGDGLPAFIWKGTHAGNALVMRSGSVGVAVFGGEAATLATFVVDGGELTLGSGVTLSGALVVNGGAVRINSAVGGSLTVSAGEVVIDGTGAVAQLTINGGRVTYNTTGTLGGNTVVSGDGVLDFGQAPGTTQVTNAIDIHGKECRVLDPLGRIWDGATASKLVVDGNHGADAGTQVEWGTDKRLTRAATA